MTEEFEYQIDEPVRLTFHELELRWTETFADEDALIQFAYEMDIDWINVYEGGKLARRYTISMRDVQEQELEGATFWGFTDPYFLLTYD